MDAYGVICYSEILVGQAAKALECADKAMRLSPHDPFIAQFFATKAFAFAILGRDAEALTLQDHLLILVQNPPPRAYLGLRVILLANLGRDQEAREAYQRYSDGKVKNLADLRVYLSRAYPEPAMRAWIEEDIAGMRKAGMPEQ
jgi:adenylate cyclase